MMAARQEFPEADVGPEHATEMEVTHPYKVQLHAGPRKSFVEVHHPVAQFYDATSFGLYEDVDIVQSASVAVVFLTVGWKYLCRPRTPEDGASEAPDEDMLEALGIEPERIQMGCHEEVDSAHLMDTALAASA
jgi:hypothetical protein